MKRVLFLMTFFAFTATFAMAQSTEAVSLTEAQENTDGPAISFEATTVDYGVIEQGGEPYRTFTFTNTGTEPLVIKHAKGSCGCTVPTYPKEPIEPGTTGEIKVRYDTNRIGKFNKRVTLTTNVGEEQVMLYIKGEVKPKPQKPAGVPSGDKNMINNSGNN